MTFQRNSVMKNALLALSFLISYTSMRSQEPLYDKVFFANSLMDESYFYSEAVYTSPSWIKNYRTGLLWKSFMSCPEVQSGLQKLASESP